MTRVSITRFYNLLVIGLRFIVFLLTAMTVHAEQVLPTDVSGPPARQVGIANPAYSESNKQQLIEQYGKQNTARFDAAAPVESIVADAPDYHQQIKPLLEQRCVVCHGCYDSPCQFNLGSYEGLARGSSPEPVYDGLRLFPQQPTRLHIDAQTPAGWREKGFSSMLNEFAPSTPSQNLRMSVLYRLLQLKQDDQQFVSRINPQPLPDQFDFSLNRAQECPTINTIEDHLQRYAHAGMPYGLPALTAKEHRLLVRWIAAGAPFNPALRERYALQDQVLIQRWEQRLNQPDLKSRLVSRYLYEHWFLANLYFDEPDAEPDTEQARFYRMVRSTTPPGQPVELVKTRRPFDDPGVEQVYYRLLPKRDTVLVKTHLPYALSEARWQKLQQWFYQPDYEVTEWPGYAPDTAANPFITYAQLPLSSRYRFMLDEAEYIIMGYIKGPVCRGQTALSVIDDYFWVFFVDPDLTSRFDDNHYLEQALESIRLPAEEQSGAALLGWGDYADHQKRYLQSKKVLMNREFSQKPIDLSIIWRGTDSQNPVINNNAALTVFRHFDSATVVKGLVGPQPDTAWLIDYPVLERVHYLLTAGFDVFGNLGHQLKTRLYMDFLRMESEANFIALLPFEQRMTIRDAWYQDTDEVPRAFLQGSYFSFNQPTAIPYTTDNPLDELYAKLKQHVRTVSDKPVVDSDHPLNDLQAQASTAYSFMPEVSFVVVREPEPRFYTLLRNTALANNAHLFREAARRQPAQDTLSVIDGLLGSHPNWFFELQADEQTRFAQQVQQLQTDQDFSALAQRYGIRRMDPRFWSISDEMNHYYRQQEGIQAGLLDLNRYQNH